MKTGVECEFFLISPDGSAITDAADTQSKPCYDQSALMRRYDVISEICDSMLELGWAPYQNDHEDANGQFEMNWHFDDALITADRHAFFKYMVKSIAEKHGLRATFMPKPFANLTGSGCHVHVSLWQDGNKNLFDDAKDEIGLSQQGLQFHRRRDEFGRRALLRSPIPTVNSYKRINAPLTISGATWSPNTVTYDRQQPHPHDPHSGRRPLRVPARRRRRQPLSPAGRDPRRWSRGELQRASSRYPDHVVRGCCRHRSRCWATSRTGRGDRASMRL